MSAATVAKVEIVSKWTAAAVWLYAFGYFAAYLPYSAITKGLTSGFIDGVPRTTGLMVLPVAAITSTVGMLLTITALRWWRYSGRRQLGPISVPFPGIWTFFSGLATSAIIVTTTLAYTFHDVSIPFIMLLMRGGVLLLAPIVDFLSGRKVHWYSAVALVMSMLALIDALTQNKGFAMPLLCVFDVALYLLGYFIRLRFMSRLAKSEDKAVRLRYFVEEQMVATPAAVFMLGVLALFASSTGPLAELRSGFTTMWTSPALPWVVLLGLLSQGTGVFGGLVLLDARENTFSVPLNRASSILAGVGAGFTLSTLFPKLTHSPHAFELVGAGLLVVAIIVLWAGPRLKRKPA